MIMEFPFPHLNEIYTLKLFKKQTIIQNNASFTNKISPMKP